VRLPGSQRHHPGSGGTKGQRPGHGSTGQLAQQRIHRVLVLIGIRPDAAPTQEAQDLLADPSGKLIEFLPSRLRQRPEHRAAFVVQHVNPIGPQGVSGEVLGLVAGQVEQSPMEECIVLKTETRFKRGGRGLRYVIPGPEGAWGRAQQDKPLIQAVARGRFWYDLLLTGQAKSREEIAKTHGFSGAHVSRHLPLAWLAPDIVEAILEGRQPKALTVQRLQEKLPLDWAEQLRVLGFGAKVQAS
jgi:hypothetical protein